jgi:hypothetical protein
MKVRDPEGIGVTGTRQSTRLRKLQKPTNSFCFLSLPGEIQLEICKILLEDDTAVDGQSTATVKPRDSMALPVDQQSNRSNAGSGPVNAPTNYLQVPDTSAPRFDVVSASAFLRTCRSIHIILARLFWHKARATFTDPVIFAHSFLGMVSGDKFHNLRQVRCRLQSPLPSENEQERRDYKRSVRKLIEVLCTYRGLRTLQCFRLEIVGQADAGNFINNKLIDAERSDSAWQLSYLRSWWWHWDHRHDHILIDMEDALLKKTFKEFAVTRGYMLDPAFSDDPTNPRRAHNHAWYVPDDRRRIHYCVQFTRNGTDS